MKQERKFLLDLMKSFSLLLFGRLLRDVLDIFLTSRTVLESITPDMHSPQNKKRSNLLINGFIRHYKRTNDFNRFPSELVHLIFDLYYLIHGEWLNQNINIQIVSGVNGDKYEDVYLGAETAPWYPYAYDTLCVTDYPSFSSECETSIWRMYPKPECGGFILRPTNLLESESATKRKRFLGICS